MKKILASLAIVLCITLTMMGGGAVDAPLI